MLMPFIEMTGIITLLVFVSCLLTQLVLWGLGVQNKTSLKQASISALVVDILVLSCVGITVILIQALRPIIQALLN